VTGGRGGLESAFSPSPSLPVPPSVSETKGIRFTEDRLTAEMDLWLLRHAVAEDRAASGRDEDRELTPEGARRAKSVARGLVALDPVIDLVITSPYRRARQTADPVVEALGLGKNFRESAALEPSTDPEEILKEVETEEERKGILLVGHQPHLGALLGRLVGGNRGPEIPLKKAAVARVELSGRGRGQLRALLPAPVLERIGHSKD
jgi:phosphohistidine phosphatase